jgi:tetratricopeptide (TPR) repeat protein
MSTTLRCTKFQTLREIALSHNLFARRLTIVAWAVLAFAGIGIAQTQKTPPNPLIQGQKDSITVTADYPKEQIKNEDDCDAKLKAGQDALRQRAFDKAEQYFQDAWAMTQKYAYLANRQDKLLEAIGTTYLMQNRMSEAIETSKKRVDLNSKDCQPGGEWPANCAQAQVSLASAIALSGNLADALAILTSAVSNYQRQVASDDFAELKNVHQARQGEAMALQAALTARSGDREKARSIITSARTIVEPLVSADDSGPGARELARNVLAAITDVAKQLQAK